MPTLSLSARRNRIWRARGLPGEAKSYAHAEPGASGCVAIAMHLVELFLPLRRNDGSPQPPALFAELRAELVDRFGGLTAFTRSPAEGLWEEPGGAVDRDSIVIVEVMAETLDRRWWADFRARLEARFGQRQLLVRATAVERL